MSITSHDALSPDFAEMLYLIAAYQRQQYAVITSKLLVEHFVLRSMMRNTINLCPLSSILQQAVKSSMQKLQLLAFISLQLQQQLRDNAQSISVHMQPVRWTSPDNVI